MITHEFWLLFRKLLERCNRAVVRTCQACDAGSKSQNGGVQGAAVLTTTGPYVAEFSTEAFVLLLYRGRNLRGFLCVVTDRTDLLPIEIFRGCVQEAKLSPWPPEAHIEPQNHLLGLPPRKDSEHPLRGHFSGAPQLQVPRPGTCRRAGLRRAACAAGTETDAGPRTMKAMRDLQSARKLLTNVCDVTVGCCAVLHTSRERGSGLADADLVQGAAVLGTSGRGEHRRNGARRHSSEVLCREVGRDGGQGRCGRVDRFRRRGPTFMDCLKACQEQLRVVKARSKAVCCAEHMSRLRSG